MLFSQIDPTPLGMLKHVCGGLFGFDCLDHRNTRFVSVTNAVSGPQRDQKWAKSAFPKKQSKNIGRHVGTIFGPHKQAKRLEGERIVDYVIFRVWVMPKS